MEVEDMVQGLLTCRGCRFCRTASSACTIKLASPFAANRSIQLLSQVVTFRHDLSFSGMVDYLLPPPSDTPTVREADGLGVYRVPPLDGSLSVPEIYDWHYRHNPDFPLFQYLENGQVPIRITYSQAIPAIHRAGRMMKSYINRSEIPQPVFAILSSTGARFHFSSPASKSQ